MLIKCQEEDDVIKCFFFECKNYLSDELWDEYYCIWVESNWFYAFECVIKFLSDEQIPITPNMRKSIDNCLEIFKIDRKDIKFLNLLNFDNYWKNRYGY